MCEHDLDQWDYIIAFLEKIGNNKRTKIIRSFSNVNLIWKCSTRCFKQILRLVFYLAIANLRSNDVVKIF